MRADKKEHGGSTISNILWLGVLVAFVYGCWNFIPAYYAHYTLRDRAEEFARLHPSMHRDDAIQQKVMKEVRELRLDPWIYPQNIRVTTRDSSRQIAISYEREIPIVPGFKYTWNRPIQVDQPFY